MPTKYDTREAIHGGSRAFYAPINRDPDTGAITFGTPKALTGWRASSLEPSQDSNPYYADNVEHIRLQGIKTIDGSMTLYQIAKDFMLNHLAKKEMPNGAIVDTGTYKAFVLGYVETVDNEFGEQTEELHIWYNIKASSPTAATSTDEDSPEPKEIEIPLTASPNNGVLDTDGKAVTELVLRKTSQNKAFFESAFDKVILPTDQLPSSGS